MPGWIPVPDFSGTGFKSRGCDVFAINRFVGKPLHNREAAQRNRDGLQQNFKPLNTRSSAQRGFTLLELLVVVTIILIAIGVVIPNLNTLDNSTFNAQVRNAVASLTYTRRVAIVEARPKTVAFFALDTESPGYDALRAQADDKNLDASWSSELVSLRYQADPNRPAEDVTQVAITFFPQGGSTGGVLNFTANERSALISIDPITGRIATAYNGEELEQEY